MFGGGDRWNILRDYVESMATGTSVNELAEHTLTTALEALAASSASVSRFELERGRVKILHNRGHLADWEEIWPHDNYYILSEYTQLMSTVGGPSRSWRGSLDDPDTAGPDRDLLTRVAKRHAASFRVLVADQVWGDLYVTRDEGDQFDEEDLAVGEVLAGLMSAGLSRLELLADLSHLAYTDPLTGVGNRRAADEWLERKLSTSPSFTPVSVVLCDVNGLKGVNDSLGHTAGDDLLRLAASHITHVAEQVDDVLVTRLGGDEFVVLICDPDKATVEVVKKQLQELQLPQGTGLAVGAATTARRPDENESTKTAARSLMRLADAAQYRHKRMRRASSDPLPDLHSPNPTLLPEDAGLVIDVALRAFSAAPSRSTEWRLQVAADVVSQVYDVATWWVSYHEDGVLFDVLGRLLRPDSRGALAGVDFQSATTYDAKHFPATLAALQGGSYIATLTEGDKAERALLARLGYVSVVAAGEPGADGRRWLVELFGDTQTSTALFAAEPSLRALVHIAVQGAPIGSTHGAVRIDGETAPS